MTKGLNISLVFLFLDDKWTLHSEFRERKSEAERVKRPTLPHVITHSMLTISQTSKNSYKEWLEARIKEGSIYCCPENDIKLDPLHIGSGGFGAVYKATIKENYGVGIFFGKKQNIYSGMTVAVKILFPNGHGDSEEDLHQQLVKEVAITFLLSCRTFILRID